MVNSMTGYGRAFETIGGREITAEVKSVNHRYLETSVRLPRTYSFLEDRIKSLVQKSVSRGKVDVGITITQKQDAGSLIEPNLEIARGYYEALQKIASELNIKSDVTASSIARFSDVFSVTAELPDEDALWRDVQKVLSQALQSFADMRAAEGERLKTDITGKLSNLEAMLDKVESDAEGKIEKYREKLYDKMKKVLEDKNIDENRILLEAALYADRSAIDEETVRLRSHIAQFRSIFVSKEPSGRKLDFLTQEINREVNTIGSKANELDITNTVVEMKSEIEKIREQIQNIE